MREQKQRQKGDGHISMGDRFNYPKINGRLVFTFSVQNLPYLRYLKFVLYAPFCTNSVTPWPNPKTTNKEATTVWCHRQLPLFTEMHKVWYKEVEGKSVKILPSNIEELLTPISIALPSGPWIMGDGYWEL